MHRAVDENNEDEARRCLQEGPSLKVWLHPMTEEPALARAFGSKCRHILLLANGCQFEDVGAVEFRCGNLDNDEDRRKQASAAKEQARPEETSSQWCDVREKMHRAIDDDNHIQACQCLQDASHLSMWLHPNTEQSVMYRALVKKSLLQRSKCHFKDDKEKSFFGDFKEFHRSQQVYVRNKESYTYDITDAVLQQPGVFGERLESMVHQMEKNAFLCTILKVAHNAHYLKIIVDHENEDVQTMVGCATGGNVGLTIFDRKEIFIGDKKEGSTETVSDTEVRGTLTHEICYMALHLVYNNYGKPYPMHDVVKKSQYEKVIEDTKKPSENLDLVIKRAFKYNTEEELIVRVPHIIALYPSFADGVPYLQNNAPELFQFFKGKVIPDMKKYVRDASPGIDAMIIGLENARLGKATRTSDLKLTFKKPLMHDDLKDVHLLILTATDLWLLEILVHNVVKSTGHPYLFFDTSQSDEKLSKVVLGSKCNFLLLSYNTKVDFRKILEVLSCASKAVKANAIVLFKTGEQGDFVKETEENAFFNNKMRVDIGKTEACLDDVKEDCIIEVLGLSHIRFQRRCHTVAFEQVMKLADFSRLLDTTTFQKLCQLHYIELGEALQEPEQDGVNYYVTRKLERAVFVDLAKISLDSDNEAFAFLGCSEDVISKSLSHSENVYRKNILQKFEEWVLHDNSDDYEDLIKMDYFQGKTVHLLKYDASRKDVSKIWDGEDGHFVWAKSNGPLSHLPVSVPLTEEYLWKTKEKVVAVCGQPGIGKSALAFRIISEVEKEEQTKCVLYINLAQKMCLVKLEDEPKYLEHLARSCGIAQDQMEFQWFKKSVEEGTPFQLVTIFDGFDEINDSDRKYILQLVRHRSQTRVSKIFLFSRTVSVSKGEPTENTQISDGDRAIFGIFKRYVDYKYETYFKEKSKQDVRTAQRDYENIKESAARDTRLLAISVIFDDKVQQKILTPGECKAFDSKGKFISDAGQNLLGHGIVDGVRKDKPLFIHRTFADFFAAHYLFGKIRDSKNDTTDVVKSVLEMYGNDEYELVMYFLDNFAADSRPIHSAIINGSVSNLGCNVTKLDVSGLGKFRRTPLHLAALYADADTLKNVEQRDCEIRKQAALRSSRGLPLGVSFEGERQRKILRRGGHNAVDPEGGLVSDVAESRLGHDIPIGVTSGYPLFINKTFVEFFAAQYLLGNINDSENGATNIVNSTQQKQSHIDHIKNAVEPRTGDFKEKICENLDKLDISDLLSTILKVIATLPDVKIILDCTDEENRPTLEYPTGEEFGITFYEDHVITIGGKKEKSKQDAPIADLLGILAHELCHLALHLVYRNYGKPYLIDDLDKKRSYDKVIKDTVTFTGELDRVISSAFEYDTEEELIVRVPHLIAIYGGPDRGEDVLKCQAAALLEFFKSHVLPDMDDFLQNTGPRTQAKNILKVNERLGKTKKTDDMEVSSEDTLAPLDSIDVPLLTPHDLCPIEVFVQEYLKYTKNPYLYLQVSPWSGDNGTQRNKCKFFILSGDEIEGCLQRLVALSAILWTSGTRVVLPLVQQNDCFREEINMNTFIAENHDVTYVCQVHFDKIEREYMVREEPDVRFRGTVYRVPLKEISDRFICTFDDVTTYVELRRLGYVDLEPLHAEQQQRGKEWEIKRTLRRSVEEYLATISLGAAGKVFGFFPGKKTALRYPVLIGTIADRKQSSMIGSETEHDAGQPSSVFEMYRASVEHQYKIREKSLPICAAAPDDANGTPEELYYKHGLPAVSLICEEQMQETLRASTPKYFGPDENHVEDMVNNRVGNVCPVDRIIYEARRFNRGRIAEFIAEDFLFCKIMYMIPSAHYINAGNEYKQVMLSLDSSFSEYCDLRSVSSDRNASSGTTEQNMNVPDEHPQTRIPAFHAVRIVFKNVGRNGSRVRKNKVRKNGIRKQKARKHDVSKCRFQNVETCLLDFHDPFIATLLYTSERKEKTESVKLLLLRPRTNRPDSDGRTPLQLALERDWPGVIDLLLPHSSTTFHGEERSLPQSQHRICIQMVQNGSSRIEICCGMVVSLYHSPKKLCQIALHARRKETYHRAFQSLFPYLNTGEHVVRFIRGETAKKSQKQDQSLLKQLFPRGFLFIDKMAVLVCKDVPRLFKCVKLCSFCNLLKRACRFRGEI